MQIKADNLTLYDSTLNETFSKSFAFNAPSRKLEYLGRLALVVDIDIKNEFAEKIAEIISDVIKQEYYREKGTDSKNILPHFESALNKVNQALSTLASEGYVEWIDKLNVAMAAISINRVHLAFSGRTKVFLHRNNDMVDLTAGTTAPQ